MSVDLLASLRRAYPSRWAITYLCQLHPLIGVPSILSFSPSSQLIVSVSSSALGLAARRLVSHVSLGNMSFIHTLITTPHRSCQTYSKISPCLHLPRSLGDLRLGHGDPLNFLVDLRFGGVLRFGLEGVPTMMRVAPGRPDSREASDEERSEY